MGPKFLLDPNFLVQKIWEAIFFWDPNFSRLKNFWNLNFSRPKFYATQIFLALTFFRDANFLWPEILGIKNFWGPKFFGPRFFGPKFFWTQRFLYTQDFWTQNFFATENLGLKFFSGLNNHWEPIISVIKTFWDLYFFRCTNFPEPKFSEIRIFFATTNFLGAKIFRVLKKSYLNWVLS